MRAICNLLWFILGGVFMGLGWWLVGALAFITIVNIPWGRACLVMGSFSFFPFGKEVAAAAHQRNAAAAVDRLRDPP